jgi:hypothetical protein
MRREKISSSELVEFDLIAVICDTKKKIRESCCRHEDRRDIQLNKKGGKKLVR